MSSEPNWADGHIDWVASHEIWEEFVAEEEAGHQAVGSAAPKAKKKKAVGLPSGSLLDVVLTVL